MAAFSVCAMRYAAAMRTVATCTVATCLLFSSSCNAGLFRTECVAVGMRESPDKERLGTRQAECSTPRVYQSSVEFLGGW